MIQKMPPLVGSRTIGANRVLTPLCITAEDELKIFKDRFPGEIPVPTVHANVEITLPDGLLFCHFTQVSLDPDVLINRVCNLASDFLNEM